MAKAYIIDVAGGTAEQYDRTMEEMGLDGVLPEGAIFHYAGATETGWRATDAWADPDAFDRFAQEQIGPLTAKHGLTPMTMESFDVATQYTGPLRRPEIVQLVRLPGLDEAGFRAAHARIVPGDWPEALVHHVNGPYDGGWIVLDSWETAAAHDAFIQQRVMPVMQEVPMSGPPQIEVMRVHGLVIEPATATA
jgi:hypothetical protein